MRREGGLFEARASCTLHDRFHGYNTTEPVTTRNEGGGDAPHPETTRATLSLLRFSSIQNDSLEELRPFKRGIFSVIPSKRNIAAISECAAPKDTLR